MAELTHHQVSVNGITLHVVEAGPQTGKPVILLHGFPEFWYGWHRQIEFLAAKGFHVVAPDQRGYNLSDKPKKVAAYGIDTLADDILGLAKFFFSSNEIYLVGHDWGAAVAWWVAMRNPERLKKLAILNGPHPLVMRNQLKNNRAQRRKSWYMFLFQLPIPQRMLRNMMRKGLAAAPAGSFSSEDLQKYEDAWNQPNAVRGMVNWYRASMRTRPKRLATSRVTVPTLVIWGKRDRFLSLDVARESAAQCDDGELMWIDEATHWVQHDAPERVNELLGEFLQDGRKNSTIKEGESSQN